MIDRRIAAVLSAIAVTGCGTDQVAEEPFPGPPSAIDSAELAPPTGAADGTGGWVVTPAGAGSVRVGMTVPELLPHLEAGADTTGLGDGCNYVRVAEAPDSTGFMVEAGRLVRIDVYGGGTATAEGARVGDPETRILELYPNARRGPHKYTDGFYLTVLTDAPMDTLARYVFETDGESVVNFRAGIFPPVEYVERCS